MDITKTYFKMLRDGTPSDQTIAYYLKHTKAITDNARQFFKETEKPAYFYLVTFTLKPSISSSDYDNIEAYIRKQFVDRPSLGVKEAHLVRELTKLNIPHWHVSVQTDRPLKKDRFHYYTKLYGQIDISKNKAQNLQDGLNYISKSNTPEKLATTDDLTLSSSQKGTKDYSRSMFLDFDP